MADARIEADLKGDLYEQFARVGKALGSGKRLELLDLIAQGERTVDALARAAGLGLTTASAHLQTLKRAGVVTTRREGTRVYYRLAGDDVAALYVLLRGVAQRHLAETERARAAYLGAGTEAVGRDELLARAEEGSVVVLDVRSHEEYAAGHIPGALSVPLAELDERLAALPPDREVVAYCRGGYCVLAYDAVRLLRSHGRRARRLADGMLEWRVAGLPVAVGAAD
ncbi:metalloregulator ArsR/SmtB family transcription factor [Streptomyces sp. NPDC006997]|uniref:ArsR/SmtB family transcription factor n=1 Tax=Streptomyces sp. NPDC006997 TaxID=3155356 RepID=UPI0033EAA13A